METFALLAQGLSVAFSPMILLYALIEVTLGTAVGVLPGIGPALTVALLLPVTYGLDPAGSLIILLRRDVWRFDDLDPAEHAGGKRVHLDGP